MEERINTVSNNTMSEIHYYSDEEEGIDTERGVSSKA